MADTDANVIRTWHNRLRKRGRVGAAVLALGPAEVDVRAGRPTAPERLSAAERELWDKIVLARRPGWFAGGEAILESYVVTATRVQAIEAVLRTMPPDTSAEHEKLARTHRQYVSLAATLARSLRLVPSTRLDRTRPQDGDQPVA